MDSPPLPLYCPRIHRAPTTDATRAAAAALDAACDHVGPARTIVVLVSLTDPWGVELGGDVSTEVALHLLELAALKLRAGLMR